MGKRPTNARTSRIMATEQPQKTFAGPSRTVHADYPLIDNDPHFKRVIGYARTPDYAVGGLAALSGPGLMYAVEKFAPSHAGRGAFPKIMRLAGAIGITGGFLIFYQRSILRFYGATENRREVDKVKRGESLYGESQLSPHMQGVAARQSRYSALFMGVVPWFNFVNHSQHGVDTAKYYQQAERELEAEKRA